jgi:gas vesicle protein
MTETTESAVRYFLVGLGVGSMVGILLAPKSGEEIRETLATKGTEGAKYVREKAQELRDRTENAIERGKEAVKQKKDEIVTALDVGRETYQREKAKAHSA